jgi:lipopolysaccharide biosynthesis glycosyltransferase
MKSVTRDSATIVVACASDQRYALPLAVMLHSVGVHVAPGVQIDAYALDDGVAEEDRRRVAASLPGNVHLTWRRPVSSVEGLPTWGRMPLTTYHKLALDEWLPANLTRALWLDCDLLAVDDLSPLWRCGMGGNTVLAVRDQRVPVVSARFGVTAWREQGLPEGATYFNAGVMVVDLERWHACDVRRRCHEYLDTHRDQVYFWDQEALNAVLAGHWGELHPRWNSDPSLDDLVGYGGSRRGPGPAHKPSALTERGILHFSGNLKPWSFAGDGPCRRLYWSYEDRTAWAGVRPPRRWHDGLLGWYESSRLRRLVYPAESLALVGLRRLTRRSPSTPSQGAHRGRAETFGRPGDRRLRDDRPCGRELATADGA